MAKISLDSELKACHGCKLNSNTRGNRGCMKVYCGATADWVTPSERCKRRIPPTVSINYVGEYLKALPQNRDQGFAGKGEVT
jgi:hypothetical protein